MKKEVLLAVILGLIVGLVITYGIYNARKAVQTIQSTTQQNRIQGELPEATSSGTLVLSAPDDNSIQALTETAVTGTTQPGSDVIVLVNGNPGFITADDTGSFQFPTALEAGSNVITVFSIDQQGKQAKQTRFVVVSSADLDGESATTSAGQATEATASGEQDVQQNIKNRIEKVLEDKKGQTAQKPSAYIGTIERVSSEAITVNTPTGNRIMQISEDTVFVSGSTQREVKSSDLEIGSWVIVMGYLKENSFEARRIVISGEPLLPDPVSVIAGTIETIGKSLIQAVSRTGKQVALLLSRMTGYQNLDGKITVSDIEERDPFIALFDETEEGTPSAVLIRILKTSAEAQP